MSGIGASDAGAVIKCNQRPRMDLAISEQVHSDLIRANFITLAHFSKSSAMNLPNSAGDVAIGSTPKLTSCAFSLGSARATFVAALTLLTMWAGVFLGAPRPYQPIAS